MAVMKPRPDLLLYGGQVLTIDPAFHVAEAVAVADDRIMAVGASTDIRHLADGDTRLVELKGRVVVPGLIDAHAHMDHERLKTIHPSLAGVRSMRDEARTGAASPEGAGFFMDSLDPPIRGRRHRATIIFHIRPCP